MNDTQHEMLVRIDERTKTLVAGQADQEKRIRLLEKWRTALAATITAASGGIASIFGINQ